jgi:hypothetical protein
MSMDEQRVPINLRLLTVLGALLGAGLALEGLHARLFGAFLPLEGVLGVWNRVGAELQIGPVDLGPAELGWPLVVVGSMWTGALSGLWLRSRWGYRACQILGILSLGYIGVGTLLALGVLVLLRTGSVRRWSGRGSVPGGG